MTQLLCFCSLLVPGRGLLAPSAAWLGPLFLAMKSLHLFSKKNKKNKLTLFCVRILESMLFNKSLYQPILFDSYFNYKINRCGFRCNPFHISYPKVMFGTLVLNNYFLWKIPFWQMPYYRNILQYSFFTMQPLFFELFLAKPNLGIQ